MPGLQSGLDTGERVSELQLVGAAVCLRGDVPAADGSPHGEQSAQVAVAMGGVSGEPPRRDRADGLV
jgi:hypothetical protein